MDLLARARRVATRTHRTLGHVDTQDPAPTRTRIAARPAFSLQVAAENVGSQALVMQAIILLALLFATSPAAAQSVSVQAEHHNMFRVNVRLNNQIDVRALIDTGASSLSLCEAMAKQLRLQLGAAVRLSTANGVIPARRAMVDSIRIAGAIEVRNVGAVVKADDASCDEISHWHVGAQKVARHAQRQQADDGCPICFDRLEAVVIACCHLRGVVGVTHWCPEAPSRLIAPTASPAFLAVILFPASGFQCVR